LSGYISISTNYPNKISSFVLTEFFIEEDTLADSQKELNLDDKAKNPLLGKKNIV
jgi:hypothetical protein